jgi:hypothetical protein
MLRLKRIFKNYEETGSLNELVNLYGFIDQNVFLTKTGSLGVILELRGVDYECLDGASLDQLTKRLESAPKLFDDNYRVYQYLFKRNNETIPFERYANPVVAAAIENRIAYLRSRAENLFSVSIYFVVLFEASASVYELASTIGQFSAAPAKPLKRLLTRFSSKKQIVFLDRTVSQAQTLLRQRIESFILQVSDFVAVRMLDKHEAFRMMKKTLFYFAKNRPRETEARHLSRLLPAGIALGVSPWASPSGRLLRQSPHPERTFRPEFSADLQDAARGAGKLLYRHLVEKERLRQDTSHRRVIEIHLAKKRALGVVEVPAL